jgi:hypothetical protein
MKFKKTFILALLAYAVFTSACMYIVLPEGLETTGAKVEGAELRVWNGTVTNINQTDTGDLHIDVSIRNDTGEWATMQSLASKPAELKVGNSKSVNCDVVSIGTGGHRLAPGFQMRGYTTGKGDDLQIQPLFVECAGAEIGENSTLSIPYVSFQGDLDDYSPDANKTNGVLVLNLDEVESNLTFPVASPVEGLIQDEAVNMTALSDNIVSLRPASGFSSLVVIQDHDDLSVNRNLRLPSVPPLAPCFRVGDSRLRPASGFSSLVVIMDGVGSLPV